MEGQPLLLPSTPIPRLLTLENRAVYLYALEELVRPDLVSVLPSVRTVNAIVEMGQAWGDQPLFEVSLRRDVLERFAQLGLDREVVIPADNR